MRLCECLRLRVKDIDFSYREIVLRDRKGAKDRVTMLPNRLIPELEAHLVRVRELHGADPKEGGGTVYVPVGLARKYLSAADAGW